MYPVGSVLANCVYYSMYSYQKCTDAAFCFYNVLANISFSSFSLSDKTVFPSEIEEKHLTPDFFSRHSALLQNAAEKEELLIKNEATVALCAFVYWLSGKKDSVEVNTFTSVVCKKAIRRVVRKTTKKRAEYIKSLVLNHIHELRNNYTVVDNSYYFSKTVQFISPRFSFPYAQIETACYTKQEVDTYTFFRIRCKRKSARKVFLKKVPKIVFSKALVSRLQHLHKTHPSSYVKIDGKLQNWAVVWNRFQWTEYPSLTEEPIEKLLATFEEMQSVFEGCEEMDRLVREDCLTVCQLVALQKLRNSFNRFGLFPTDEEKRKIRRVSGRFFEQLTGFTELKVVYGGGTSDSELNDLEFLRLRCDRLEQLYCERGNLAKLRNWQSEDWQLVLTLCCVATYFKGNLGYDKHPLDKQFNKWSKSILFSCIIKNQYFSRIALRLIKNFPERGVAELIRKLEKIANHPPQLCDSEKLTLAECQLVQNMFKIFYKSGSPVEDLFQLKEWDRLSKRKKTKSHAIIACSVNSRLLPLLEQNMRPPPKSIRERVCLYIAPILTRLQVNGHVNFLSRDKGRWKAYGAMNGLTNYGKECSGRLQPYINSFIIHPEVLMNKELRRKNAEKEFRQLFFTHLQEILSHKREFQDDGLQNKWRRIVTRRTWKQMQPKDVEFTPDRISFCSQYMCTSVVKAAVQTYSSMSQDPPASLEIFGLHPFDNVHNALPDQVIAAFISSKLFQKQPNRLLDVVQI